MELEWCSPSSLKEKEFGGWGLRSRGMRVGIYLNGYGGVWYLRFYASILKEEAKRFQRLLITYFFRRCATGWISFAIILACVNRRRASKNLNLEAAFSFNVDRRRFSNRGIETEDFLSWMSIHKFSFIGKRQQRTVIAVDESILER